MENKDSIIRNIKSLKEYHNKIQRQNKTLLEKERELRNKAVNYVSHFKSNAMENRDLNLLIKNNNYMDLVSISSVVKSLTKHRDVIKNPKMNLIISLLEKANNVSQEHKILKKELNQLLR
ncbi:MAG: hypothetical protein GKR88_11320 [Flavobacteriaceae bacterium]|nr:MAG: hypothetical protein GKR88_11320 [Flavobacteriaceae bacterium]